MGYSSGGSRRVSSVSLDLTLLGAVDEGLAVLGESCKQAVFYYVMRKYGVRRELIHEQVESFQKALDDLFGAGAKVITRLIAQKLYDKLGFDFEERRDWTLVNYVDHAKKLLAAS